MAVGNLPGTYPIEPEEKTTDPAVYRRYLEMPMQVRDYFHAYLATHHDMGMDVDEVSLTGMMDAAERRFAEDFGRPAPRLDWRPAPQAHADVVYYIRFDALLKIGWTTNIHLRLSQLPHDRLLAVEWGGRKVEVGRHEQFSAARRNGEWFHFTAPLRKHVEMVRARFEEDVSMDTESWMQHLLAKRSTDRLT